MMKNIFDRGDISINLEDDKIYIYTVNGCCTGAILSVNEVLGLVNELPLGENARRMLEIGRCQDFLMDNDFEADGYSWWVLHTEDGRTNIEFNLNFNFIRVASNCGILFEFSTQSKTFYTDFISKIKELINDK